MEEEDTYSEYDYHPDSHLKQLTDGIESMHNNEKYADLTIICGDRQWKVHKVDVCSQSPFFAKACDGGWKVRDLRLPALDRSNIVKEAKEHCVRLDEDVPDAVNAMIAYFYTGFYKNKDEDRTYASPRLHITVYDLADKYDLHQLLLRAAVGFSQWAELKWKHQDFATAIQEIYTSAADRQGHLKRSIMEVSARRALYLFHNDVGEAFREVASSLPAFAAELAAFMAAEQAKSKKDAFFLGIHTSSMSEATYSFAQVMRKRGAGGAIVTTQQLMREGHLSEREATEAVEEFRSCIAFQVLENGRYALLDSV